MVGLDSELLPMQAAPPTLPHPGSRNAGVSPHGPLARHRLVAPLALGGVKRLVGVANEIHGAGCPSGPVHVAGESDGRGDLELPALRIDMRLLGDGLA